MSYKLVHHLQDIYKKKCKSFSGGVSISNSDRYPWKLSMVKKNYHYFSSVTFCKVRHKTSYTFATQMLSWLKPSPLFVKFNSLVSKNENWLITKSKEFIDYVNDTFILI